jgi:hypothetical protein
MRKAEKHPVADAGFEHDMLNHLPARHNGVSASDPADSATTEERRTTAKTPAT